MSDFFIQIEGITGDSQDANHSKWIEVVSYSHSASQIGGGPLSEAGTHTGGRADLSDFSITKLLDSASPTLNMYCCRGQHIPSIRVELCRAMGEKTLFMAYDLKDCVVSSISISGASGGEDIPVEQVSFRYSEIHWAYTPTDPASGGKTEAAVEAAWSTRENKPL